MTFYPPEAVDTSNTAVYNCSYRSCVDSTATKVDLMRGAICVLKKKIDRYRCVEVGFREMTEKENWIRCRIE